MTSTLKTLALGLLTISSCVDALPLGLEKFNFVLSRRAVIGHDKVVGFTQAVPSGTPGTLMLKYKPFLKVFNGCVPFPAVNAAGDTGGGLDTTGDPSGGCSSSPGQVYARAAASQGAYAIMYSWYMPKDSPSSGLGHRHDWENVVVWLSSESADATVRGVAISAHGDYQKETTAPFDGSRPKIGYTSTWPLNHQLISTNDKGGEQPLIAWESMTEAARAAIQNTNFGDATPSFRDSEFQKSLAEAFI
ncbi:NPP1-domain-containing protein [Byssothecium circinans]|uniref:NPP1-domain-containing protein n=1 Tax=Byssothecium circinans TaxID=147558 RepID=A0A6A5TWJ9_9PLEO|nr:NPP1-domain-containing protein [Byssothecium circinans]